MRHWSVIISVLAMTTLSACSLFTPYKIPIQQGVEISTAQLQQLTPGMSQAQVKYLLGNPNVQSPTDPNTWYYVYSDRQQGELLSKHTLTVHFKDGQLDSFSGDYPPPLPLQGSAPTIAS